MGFRYTGFTVYSTTAPFFKCRPIAFSIFLITLRLIFLACGRVFNKCPGPPYLAGIKCPPSSPERPHAATSQTIQSETKSSKIKKHQQKTSNNFDYYGKYVHFSAPATEYIISSFPLLWDTPSSFFKSRPTLQILIVPFFRSMT